MSQDKYCPAEKYCTSDTLTTLETETVHATESLIIVVILRVVILLFVAFKLTECTLESIMTHTCATQVFTFSLFECIKSCLCYDGAEGFRLVWG